MKGKEHAAAVQQVSTEWLHVNIEQTPMTIIDVQPNIHDYILEHIPGAVYLNEGILRAPLGGVPGFYVSAETIEPVLRRVGIRSDIPVVVYSGTGAFSGWGDGLGQAMMAYSLARFGHEKIYVLDGGLNKWKDECRKLVKEYPAVEASDFSVRLHKDLYIEYDEFMSIKDSNDVLLLDARPEAMYEGQGPWPKPGHIPGAVNLPWASLMFPENRMLMQPAPEIDSILAAHQVTRDKTIICSCGTGREATNEFLLLKFFLGYPNVRLYEGSFTEWAARPENPTVTGKQPYPQEAVVSKY